MSTAQLQRPTTSNSRLQVADCACPLARSSRASCKHEVTNALRSICSQCASPNPLNPWPPALPYCAHGRYNLRVVECRLASAVLALGLGADADVARGMTTLREVESLVSGRHGEGVSGQVEAVKGLLHEEPYTQDEVRPVAWEGAEGAPLMMSVCSACVRARSCACVLVCVYVCKLR